MANLSENKQAAVLRFSLLAAGLGLLLTSCATSPEVYVPVVTESDIYACDEFEGVQNPYDGTNETLWDIDGYENFQSEVDYALSDADDSDLLDFNDTLYSDAEDVIDLIEQQASKSEVEYEAEDLETVMSEVIDHCEWLREQ